MKSVYSIPRYLGVSEVKKGNNTNTIGLGFSQRLKKKIIVSKKEIPIINKLAKRGYNSIKTKHLHSLINSGVIKEDFSKNTPKKMERYDRHLLFYQSYDLNPIEVQKILSEKTVALLGMGGIGNWVSLNLIGAGLKEIRLIDFDIVELSNLTRQVLFNEKDIGKSKVNTAAEKLKPRNSQTVIKAYDVKADGINSLKESLKGVDFVIISADRPSEIHDWVNEICVKGSIPYLNIGYRDTEGVVGPLTIPGKTSCYSCFKKVTKKEKKKNSMDLKGHIYQAPSFGPLNSYVSSIGSLEMIKYFTNFGKCQSQDIELCVDPVSLKITKTKYMRDKKCKCCGDKEKK